MVPPSERRLGRTLAHVQAPPAARVAATAAVASFTSTPLPGAPAALPFGACVHGIDLSRDGGCLSSADVEAIRSLFYSRGAVLFRDQQLTPDSFAEVMRRIQAPAGANEFPGTLARMITYESTPTNPTDDAPDPSAVDAPKAHVDGYTHVRLLGNTDGKADGQQRALLCETGYEWHPDSIGSWQTALYCPHTSNALVSGGETLLFSSANAYDLLSPSQQQDAEATTAVYSNRFTSGGPSAFDCHHGLRMDATGTSVMREAQSRRPGWSLGQQRTPLVPTHSVTGRKYLAAVCKNMDHLEVADKVLEPVESRRMLTELMLPGLGGAPELGRVDDNSLLMMTATQFNPDYVYAHAWRPGDLCLWDNEQMLHSTTPVSLYEAGPEEGYRQVWQIVQDSSISETGVDAQGDGGGALVRSVHFTDTDTLLSTPHVWSKDPPPAIELRGRALTPNVIRLPDGRYRMYFHELDAGGVSCIFSAVSADPSLANEAAWEIEPGFRVRAGACEGCADGLWSPDVIPLGLTRPSTGGLQPAWRMFYEGRTRAEDSEEYTSVILSALSHDGLEFIPESGIRLSGADTPTAANGEVASFGSPRCLHMLPADRSERPTPGFVAVATKFRLYVADFTSKTIVSAVSEDGLSFELERGVRISPEGSLQSHTVYAPEVVRLGKDMGFRMYYAGWCAAPDVPEGSKYRGRIFSAYSKDGFDFEIDRDDGDGGAPTFVSDCGGTLDAA
jgi:alpha-ketoglutarate-dependent taurine dioxygenase